MGMKRFVQSARAVHNMPWNTLNPPFIIVLTTQSQKAHTLQKCSTKEQIWKVNSTSEKSFRKLVKCYHIDMTQTLAVREQVVKANLRPNLSLCWMLLKRSETHPST